jgi:hypothetical protein
VAAALMFLVIELFIPERKKLVAWTNLTSY